MSEKVRVRVIYEDPEVFFENGRKIEEIIETDTGHPVIQTKSLPPFIVPQELTQDAIAKLKAITGIRVDELPKEDE
ncbi:uncharacterized protein PGRI_079830 [Penicillium griseofulvum]|uniref:Uncharacterized protein n=1 Tax=Penicillium patulum TaxID=5078 RepID=A0A135LUT4_PENPA|nr:uncharacterized protein PGRI_079830 [Penicillium griseofulvum]KXG52727.1 hypothetical protein PGRI_079830 [Penicillium griseofulvum]